MSLLQFVGIGEVNNHPCQVGSHTNQRERVHCNSGFTKVITSIVVKLWWCPFQVPTRGNELCWDENKIKESKKRDENQEAVPFSEAIQECNERREESKKNNGKEESI